MAVETLSLLAVETLPFLAVDGLLAELFPRGIAHYLIGGLLIGIGVAIIYLGTGIAAGASTFLESTLSYVSSQERFQQARFVASRDWRVVFTLGIVAGAALYALTFQSGVVSSGLHLEPQTGELREVAGITIWVTEVQWWRLLGGGVLIGVGTRLGKGCTSGHGVCGMGSLSQTSIVNVATFMAFAIATALIVQAVGLEVPGVTP